MVNDAFNPRILFHSSLVQLLDELDTWPEKQPNHHYDGLTALHILWMVAFTRRFRFEYKSVPRENESGYRDFMG